MTLNEDLSLKGKTALITGGSKGIGRAIARTFAEAGADVAITARGAEQLEQVENEITTMNRRCLSVAADLSANDEIQKVFEKVTSEFGFVDILVNNAGAGHIVALSDLTYDQFIQTLKLNCWAALHLAQLCYQGMRQKGEGVIINIASTGGIKPDIFAGAYSASKSALIMLTKQIACEWGGDGIRSVAICPGLVRTEMAADLVAHREVHGFQNLVNRVGEPEEIATMALMLAGKAGAYCQGSIFTVDGGSTVNNFWG